MPFHLIIHYDNDKRLKRNKYIFSYRGIHFKLIQNNPRKYSDSLITIHEHLSLTEKENIFSIASEFLSALSWENKSRIMLWGPSERFTNTNISLYNIKQWYYCLPRISHVGNVIGFDINTIPYIENNEQRIALMLMREAYSSINEYLSFLFYWQILDICKTNSIDYANNIYKNNYRLHVLTNSDLTNLPLNNRKLGDYLQNDCRHAITHIKRKANGKKLELDNFTERNRILKSIIVVKKISEYYIKTHLKLNKRLYLIRKTQRSFPVYVNESFI